MGNLTVRHGILHKPSAILKFWPKSFRKSSGIFDIFCITNYAWFLTFLAWQCGKFKLYLPYCGKYPMLLSTMWNYQCFFHKTIHIVNHLEYFRHISSIKPKDLRGLPQVLPQYAKFLPRECSRRSRNIPSLGVLWFLKCAGVTCTRYNIEYWLNNGNQSGTSLLNIHRDFTAAMMRWGCNEAAPMR